MLQNNHPIPIISNNGPIIQVGNQNSQRSLYCEDPIDSPQQITRKMVRRQLVQDNSNQMNAASVQGTRNQKGLHSIPGNTSKRYKRQTDEALSRVPKQGQVNQASVRVQKQSLVQSQQKNSQKYKNNLIMTKNPAQLRHEYRNYKDLNKNVHQKDCEMGQNQKQSPKQLLKFNQKIITRNNFPFSEGFLKDSLNTTLSNFNQMNSVDSSKVNTQSIRNRSLRSSQGGRWLRSQSLIQQTQKKASLSESLIRNYHRHESKFVSSLQRYMTILMQFEQRLSSSNMGISLMQTLQEIKTNIQAYMQKLVQLQNYPIDKPTVQWTQAQLTKFFTRYEPIYLSPKAVDSSNQALTLKKYKNCVYFGNIKEGNKQGQGVIYYFSGKIYQGSFEKDQKIFGFQMNQDQDQVYVGQFDKGLRHGTGISKNGQHLSWGRFTSGEFINDRGDAQDMSKDEVSTRMGIANSSSTKSRANVQNRNNHKFTTGEQGFMLSFAYLLAHWKGEVLLKNQSNDLYIGQFNQEGRQKHGQGLEIFTNGDLYVGNYENDAPEQYGEYYWSSGAYYRGQFMSGMRHGKGKWHMLHGDMYQGQYMNDKKNGKGAYLWKNGAKYVGSFENDYRHGYGEMCWNDGRTYKGEWLNGIQKNVKINLDKGIHKAVKNPRGNLSGNTILLNQQKKVKQVKMNFLPGVTKRTLRSTSNPNTNHSFSTMDSTVPIRKKIAIQNIKALYNPSNY